MGNNQGGPNDGSLDQDINVDAANQQRRKRNIFSDTVPTSFMWPYGGRKVYLVGSFNEWRDKIPLTYSPELEQFGIVLNMPQGRHFYRVFFCNFFQIFKKNSINFSCQKIQFIVDGAQKADPKQPLVKDATGSRTPTNYVDVIKKLQIQKPHKESTTATVVPQSNHKSTITALSPNNNNGSTTPTSSNNTPITPITPNTAALVGRISPNPTPKTPIEIPNANSNSNKPNNNKIKTINDNNETAEENNNSHNKTKPHTHSNHNRTLSRPSDTEETSEYPDFSHHDQNTRNSSKKSHNKRNLDQNDNNDDNNDQENNVNSVEDGQHQFLISDADRPKMGPKQAWINEIQSRDYGQEERVFVETKKTMPIVPPHLKYTPLNSSKKYSHDTCLLPVPLHVTVNHAYMKQAPDMQVFGITQRFQGKYSTLLFFGPNNESSNDL